MKTSLANPYIIAHNDWGDEWETYMLLNEIHYGDQESADNFLEYAKRQEPKFNWRIIWLQEKINDLPIA